MRAVPRTRTLRHMSLPHLLRRGTSAVDSLRTLWGLGISTVLTLAVIPYPLMALFTESEDSHRIHDTVGALQYLPLWAVPVMLFTLGRDREGAWKLALSTSLVIAGVGVWAGDLVPAASWMPLATLLVLWPRGMRWTTRRPTVSGMAGAWLAAWVAVTVAPGLVRLQRMDLPDPHTARFHFSGTAAAYVALAMATVVVALWGAGTVLHITVAVSLALSGAANLVWPLQVSSIDAWLASALLCAAVFVGPDAVWARAQRRRRADPTAMPDTAAATNTSAITSVMP